VIGQETAGALSLSPTELGNLQEGFGTIVFGSAEGSHEIKIDTGTPGGTVTINDPVVFQTQGNGGEVRINSNLQVESLLVLGSGHTTMLNSDVTATGTGSLADVKFFDAVVVQGTRQVKSTNGSVLFSQSMTTGAGGVNGDADTTADHLTVLAAQSVTFKEAVGGSNPLESLTIGAANAKVTDVTFEKSVVIDGNLSIYATGNVNFNAGVTINQGGSLRIFSANQVAFNGGELVLNPITLGATTSPAGDSGDLYLETNSLQFPALDNSVRATGMGAEFTVRPPVRRDRSCCSRLLEPRAMQRLICQPP